jgi:hypothetical protein
MEMFMKLALLTGVAAVLSLAGAAAARADTIYIADAYPPGYVYSVPAPLPSPGYVVVDPGYTVVAPPPRAVVVAPPAVAPGPVVVAPRESGIVTTGFATTTSCYVDWRGIERCY